MINSNIKFHSYRSIKWKMININKGKQEVLHKNLFAINI